MNALIVVCNSLENFHFLLAKFSNQVHLSSSDKLGFIITSANLFVLVLNVIVLSKLVIACFKSIFEVSIHSTDLE
ncbi:MAG: hypothetical protein Q8S84_04270 [bacterium]|nr:hypothetical protein [bacterium]MDP3380720.1 hypothetical protein [bacterium]